MAGDLGLVLGPIVTGWVADAVGYSPAFVLCAVVCVLPVFAVLAAPETLQRTEPDRGGVSWHSEDAR
jgi:MFS family permease